MGLFESIKTNNIGAIFDESMTDENTIEICENLTHFNRQNEDTFVNMENTYKDLEIFHGIDDTGNILDSINKTSTFLGRNYLTKIIKNPTNDISELKHRQQIVKSLKRDGKLYEQLSTNFDKLKKLEKSV